MMSDRKEELEVSLKNKLGKNEKNPERVKRKAKHI